MILGGIIEARLRDAARLFVRLRSVFASINLAAIPKCFGLAPNSDLGCEDVEIAAKERQCTWQVFFHTGRRRMKRSGPHPKPLVERGKQYTEPSRWRLRR